jgi:hypothetical protein
LANLLNKARTFQAFTLSDGEVIYVRKISVGEYLHLETKTTNGFAQLVIQAVVDENGKALYTEKDISKLNNLELEYANEIQKTILDYNKKITAEVIEEKKSE